MKHCDHKSLNDLTVAANYKLGHCEQIGSSESLAFVILRPQILLLQMTVADQFREK